MSNIFVLPYANCPLDQHIKTHGTLAGYEGRMESEWENQFDIFGLFVWTILCQCTWDFLPYNFVSDLYHGWYKKCRFLNQPLSKDEVIQRLGILIDFDDFNRPWAEGPFGYDEEFVLSAMGRPEPMISEYGLSDWSYLQFGMTKENFMEFTVFTSYYGLRRVG